MPQEFHVVRCCECTTFQVDIKKYSTNKWTCKICNTKQTLKQVFFMGSSSECRVKIKELTELRINEDTKNDQLRLEFVMNGGLNEYQSATNNQNHNNNCATATASLGQQPKQSKWEKYLKHENNDRDF